ncbi:glycoside hydrolase family 32 protein [Sinomonas mesophila]|uniref:glycoside hydrolase family 32 protein n=1 Tax=Sinomonas mesophila TaxID=1531955 RepID=UPI000986200A|nr:glycoside hydrolase family 32 protein [Sinomonas mesophila]
MTTTAPVPTRDDYRPRVHYTPARNWMNDPNGLVFHRGVYHLFYQHNPSGPDWGNMSWGHATSTDLHTWTEQPVAIPCTGTEAIFSGSVVADPLNTAGFASRERDGAPDAGGEATVPLVAVYTSAYAEGSERPGIQAQSLAYSLDDGATWTKHEGNPVLDRGSANFRDPKVFRYAGPAGAYWVMVAVEAAERRVLLYASADLKAWRLLSEVAAADVAGGVADPGEGLWECPDLIEVPVEGKQGRTRWVLVVSVNPHGAAGGSGMKYCVGDFDGKRFRPDADGFRWLDWGRDYYAAVSFSGVTGRALMLGWMSNWDYADATPTGAWRSAMSVPREVTLRAVGGGHALVQAPVLPPGGGLASVPAGSVVHVPAGRTRLASVPRGEAFRVRLALPAGAPACTLRLGTGEDEAALLRIDPAAGTLTLDRTASGMTDFHGLFASAETAPLPGSDGGVRLDVVVDACSVEVFAQDGLVAVTDLVFPRGAETALELETDAPVVPAELEVALLG